MNPLFLDHSTVLITGASAGLGAEFARQIAPFARTLILVARRLDRLEALKAELSRPGLTIHCRQTDLADAAQVEALIGWIHESGEPLNFLINNAGLGDHGHFETSNWERIRQMLDVNIGALTRLTHGLLPLLRRQPEAAILNVSSIAGFMPIPNLGVYAATKAYVTSFTESLRAELRETGVRVTTLCPGPSPTEFGRVARRSPDAQISAPDWFQVPPEKVVQDALVAVEADRARVIPGWLVATATILIAAAPMCLLRLAMNKQAQR
jgi:hypothetical protein